MEERTGHSGPRVHRKRPSMVTVTVVVRPDLSGTRGPSVNTRRYHSPNPGMSPGLFRSHPGPPS